MMVHDHSAANEKVKTLAAQRNVTLPMAVSDESQKDIDDCSKKTGREFDKAYISDMVKKHQATIDMFEDAANKSNDADVKTFINNTLPKVREHLDSAKAIQKAIEISRRPVCTLCFLEWISYAEVKNNIFTAPVGASKFYLIYYPALTIRKPGLAKRKSHIKPNDKVGYIDS